MSGDYMIPTENDILDLINEDLGHCEKAKNFYFLSDALSSKKLIPGSFLQVQKIHNVSLTKDAQYDGNYDPFNHVVKLTLSDGKINCSAIVADKISNFSFNHIYPGTKIRINRVVPFNGHFVRLSNENCEIAGGKVGTLIEKWQMLKTREMNEKLGFRNQEIAEMPPKWTNFGTKTNVKLSEIKTAKVMDIVNEQREDNTESNTEFDVQRKETISKLSMQQGKKCFGNAKPLIQKEVADLMNQGFSQEKSEEAYRKFKNPERALKYLIGNSQPPQQQQQYDQQQQYYQPGENSGRPGRGNYSRGGRGGRRGGRRRGGGRGEGGPDGDDYPDMESLSLHSRPTKDISLFGFINGKL